MPEYLAPGVYVEETSFRAKSIEGVSTSTTAFVGPTRKGPMGETPELVTSFGDFERIYGGFDDLSSGRNYLAHAVRAYYDNGGSRLYVSRAYNSGPDPNGGRARSADLMTGDGEVRFVARHPGAAGRGRILVRQMEAPATVRSMETAPEGTLLRVGGDPARPARLEGGRPPFIVPDGGALFLRNGTPGQITFRGEPTEVGAGTELAENVALTAPNNLLRVTLEDGVEQVITIPLPAPTDPPTPVPRATILEAVNRQLRGGYARLSGAAEAPSNRLIIGSDRRGTSASVAVRANNALGFAADAAATGAANPVNNVGNLGAVTADEINALLVAASPAVGARAALLPSVSRLVLRTVATGDTATLQVEDQPASSHAALGLPAGAQVQGTAGATPTYYVKRSNNWVDSQGSTLSTVGLEPTEAPQGQADFLTLVVVAVDGDGNQRVYEDLGFDPIHPRFVGNVMAPQPSRRSDALENMYAIQISNDVTAYSLREAVFGTDDEREVMVTGGSDGAEPGVEAYREALRQLEALEDISIVAAPGHSAYTGFAGIQQALLIHVERRRGYRIAVLDLPAGRAVSEARTLRGRIDSKYAALYHPWVIVPNPLSRPGVENIPREIAIPPSGFVCGIYARNDVERGVWKAPANEIVRGALRFELDINFAEQEVLNPLGVNCLRYLTGRGYRVWGARTATSDPEWKYVNVRRYFNYLEASVDRGTQWAVFEPNGERLWANIRETVTGFLYNEWVSGALLGGSPREAFFVRCDRSTMTQNDLDNGRLVCLIGVAVIKPAEFVIFRIGQKTADARS